MAAGELPLPPHFDPSAVASVRRVPYQELAAAATDWAASHRIPLACEDSRRICLIAVDVQNTFCIPEFELYVGGRSGMGAVDDNRRLCAFIYRNMARLTRIVPTLDTHRAMQIFHPIFLIDAHGGHPPPFTTIAAEDVASGRWRVNPAVAPEIARKLAEDARGDGAEASSPTDPDYLQRHLEHYTRALAERGKFALTVWPYHSMLGGIGHALVAAVEEAIFFHGMARVSQPEFHVKGGHPLTEHYSVLGPEVASGPDGRALTGRSGMFLELAKAFDAVIIAGQAKSHCVAWTIADLLAELTAHDDSLVRRIYLLEDCASPVVIPGVVDYSDEADAAFRRFAEAGMHVVRSTEPMERWPGLTLG
ncbi:MAG: hypothetical protein JNM75_06850 [Rhodospirillales bacterium]|nr:hypothetical protein [Rhodospirillales bacterium]